MSHFLCLLYIFYFFTFYFPTSASCFLDTPFPVLELPQLLELESISAKVQPSITYGLIQYDCNGFHKGEQVEILEDVGHGMTYYVKNDSLATWVYRSALIILPTTSSVPPILSPDELTYYMNHTSKTSSTPYYIWVDLWRQRVYIFAKCDRDWCLIRQMPCATGKPTTPTARGTFQILDRGPILRSEEHVKYWVKFYKNYLFHSFPLTSSDTVLDSRIGEPISNGCVRLSEEDAAWVYETIPKDTPVWVY